MSHNEERDSDIEYNRRYQKFEENRNKMIEKGLATTKDMKRDVQETGQMITEDNRILDRINKRGD